MTGNCAQIPLIALLSDILSGGSLPAAPFVFVAAAAEAWIIAIWYIPMVANRRRLAAAGPSHDVGGRSAMPHFGRHLLHVRVHVTKKGLIALAQTVDLMLSVTRRRESMFGAAAVASEAEPTLSTGLRQKVAFGLTESNLLWACGQFPDTIVKDVPQHVFGVYEVVTGVQVPVALDD